MIKLKENIFKNYEHHPKNQDHRYPSDSMILSKMFFIYLESQVSNQNDKREKVYKNFVYKSEVSKGNYTS